MTTLTNGYIRKFDEKLKIFDSIFFKTIDGNGVLLTEASKIMGPNGLNIPTNNNATTYSVAQFSNFIRNIVNFNIKNYDTLGDKDNNMGFVNRVNGRNSQASYTLNENVRNNIIETLKVVNVFVDILEAYKYCIDNKEKDSVALPFNTGYAYDKPIDRIELVSAKTRFYTTGVMQPNEINPNVGYIRSIKEGDVDGSGKEKDIRVLYLSIQSFYTGMSDNNYNYNNIFTKTNDDQSESFDTAGTNILNSLSKDSIEDSFPLVKRNYPKQVYGGVANNPPFLSNITLEKRNKALVILLLNTLLNLESNFRTQSVFALYYYYKFVQLYSTLIINVSNVMFTDYDNSAPFRIETRNMSTSKNSRGISGIEIVTTGGGYTSSPSISISGGSGSDASISVESTGKVNIKNGGKGYKTSPTTINITGNLRQGATALQPKATIVPVVMDYSRNNDDNIEKLKDVINEISNSLSELITDISNYSANNDTSFTISTLSNDPVSTKVSLSPNNRIIITIMKACLYKRLNAYSEKYDLESDYIIYDNLNKRYYTILRIINEEENIFQIEINAVFSGEDILEGDVDTKVFKDGDGNLITKPVSSTKAVSSDMILIPSPNATFLEIRQKDTNAYKNEYIYNRDDVSKLDANISYNTSKVAYQKSQYESQFSKNLFLERQILTYNIILGIIILVLVGINLSNIDKQLVKTISLACLGTIVLLFVIYFISNMTYIETFELISTDALYDLSKSNYNLKKMNPSNYNNRKVIVLNTEIEKLNSKFISYFEKVIITLPSTDNLDFYREIKEVITNDKDTKQFINKRLEYNKSQNGNDINSLKYELEHNKLYINTLLISAIVFVGLYNLYINLVTNDKYLTLVIFISIIILIIIISYYIIASNRRVKTIFKSVYWGPEFSNRF